MPDLWSDVQERTSSALSDRSAGPAIGGWPSWTSGRRRAALVTGAAAEVLALALVAVGLRGQTTGEDGPTPTPEPMTLSEAHEMLERQLSELWVLEARRAELEGELDAAQIELDVLREASFINEDYRRRRIERLEERIQAWTRSIAQHEAEIAAHQVRVEEARATRARLLPPPDMSVYPDVATVTCDGDATGGTHLSTKRGLRTSREMDRSSRPSRPRSGPPYPSRSTRRTSRSWAIACTCCSRRVHRGSLRSRPMDSASRSSSTTRGVVSTWRR